EQFPGLVYRMSKPKVVLLLFGSGKMVCTGAKSVNDAEMATENVKKTLQELGLI
ncbi:MAG TPA: TATA-box-binding protein, partial [Euryarchaeota archaeon]|nr:TATA-box-binding protein [Euryarchaeota archaeon]